MIGHPIPTPIRVHLAHACVQVIAEAAGAPLLHVKGPAVHASLRDTITLLDAEGIPFERPRPRLSTDADVIVHPDHVAPLLAALQRHGWSMVCHFTTGSAFEHAATLWHDALGYVDVHRRFPGIGLAPRAAFDALWADRGAKEIAHVDCPVPCVEAQRLLLILHGARGGGLSNRDVDLLWTQADEPTRAGVRALVDRFGARVAFEAATGTLQRGDADPAADLWLLYASGRTPNRIDEWRARFKAAPSLRDKARVVVQAAVVNTDFLAMELGRRPTASEVRREYAKRLGSAGRSAWGLLQRGRRR